MKAIETHDLTKYYGIRKPCHEGKQGSEGGQAREGKQGSEGGRTHEGKQGSEGGRAREGKHCPQKVRGAARGIVDVNLSVEEGDFFGFIGPNGAGKSTTIRILLGLISATEGQAEIFGQDIRQDRKALLAQIGYLPAEPFVYQGMRVRDVLRFSASLRGKDCSGEAQELCRRLELDTSRRADELSLGNRKKVGIVCAMQHRPRLYILDEPTSGLDPLMQREFYALLQERNGEGATVFLSSHILSEVQRYCRHAAVIREGRLIACDSVERLGHADAKRVTLRYKGNMPAGEQAEHLKACLGRVDAGADVSGKIRDVDAAGDAVSFLYSGEPGILLKALSGLPLADITVTEPDLEEIFMHYYEGGNSR